jgi:hypothetical protein
MLTNDQRSLSGSFTQHALRNSAGADFWKNFDRMQTPPPLSFGRGSSSSMSEDVSMDTPSTTAFSGYPCQHPVSSHQSSSSRSSTPQQPVAVEMTRRLGKRRRDDDLDPHMFKRRAVSPGLSLQNSPILPSSPARGEGGWWQTKSNREAPSGHVAVERVNSGGGNTTGQPPAKRIGFQGMSDTNDGLMNMSIE